MQALLRVPSGLLLGLVPRLVGPLPLPLLPRVPVLLLRPPLPRSRRPPLHLMPSPLNFFCR